MRVLARLTPATRAAPTADGGYAFTGTKIFTSLSPVWTRLIVHARLDGAAMPKAEFPDGPPALYEG